MLRVHLNSTNLLDNNVILEITNLIFRIRRMPISDTLKDYVKMQIQITHFHFLCQLWIFMNENFFVNFFFFVTKMFTSDDWSSSANIKFRPLVINFYLKKKSTYRLFSLSLYCFPPINLYLKKKTQHLWFYWLYVTLFHA